MISASRFSKNIGRHFCAALFLLLLAVTLNYAYAKESLKARSFEFIYSATIKNIPAGAKELDVWIPCPQSDSCQKIDDVKLSSRGIRRIPGTKSPKSRSDFWGSDEVLNIEHDLDYKNAFIHIKKTSPLSPVMNFKLEFKAARTERKIEKEILNDGELALDLKPNELVTISPRIKSMAFEITKGKKTTPEKARALYDFVLSYMSYDKTGKGWGRGDTEYACDARRGNCTDFHSLFISLARAVGIPAKFEIGFLLPRDKSEGTLGGYHCWAEFYLEGKGWVPIDISEAWKDRSRADYFFGTFCENRIQFTKGRDIVLGSNKDEKKLNFFIYPYVEVEGKKFGDIETKVEFKNL